MNTRLLIIFGTGSLVAGIIFTWLIRYAALHFGIVDLPNRRSSHTRPTPSVAGLGIVLASMAGLFGAYFGGHLSQPQMIGVMGGGTLIAAVGLLDDIVGIGPWPRLGIHFLSAVWLLAWLDLGIEWQDPWRVGVVVGAALAIVWAVNLYNFMDGLDGLGGVEAASVGLSGGVLLWAEGAWGLAIAAVVCGSYTVGFLFWNWPPAKVFMGDVGSGFLGFFFASVATLATKETSISALVWLVLFGVFVIDATATLAIRIWRRERWYEAHNIHLYQQLARAKGSHAWVSKRVLFLNVGLASLVWISAKHRFDDWILAGVFVSLVLLYVATYAHFNEGEGD